MKDFIEDAEAAFQTLLDKGYRPDQIKILGYCRTTYVAAYLKLKHHTEGVDAILVNPHTSFRDVIEKSNRIGLLGLGAISTKEYDLDNEKHSAGYLIVMHLLALSLILKIALHHQIQWKGCKKLFNKADVQPSQLPKNLISNSTIQLSGINT